MCLNIPCLGHVFSYNTTLINEEKILGAAHGLHCILSSSECSQECARLVLGHMPSLPFALPLTLGECLSGARPVHARRATFVLSILALAPSVSSPRAVPQVDRTGPQTLPAKHMWAAWLHHPCLLGGRLFGEGGQKQARVETGQKKMPGAPILPPTSPCPFSLLILCTT